MSNQTSLDHLTGEKRSQKNPVREYEIVGPKGNRNVWARSISGALAIYNGRPLGKAWTLSRSPNGWVVASNEGKKSLESRALSIKEVEWSRTGRFPM